MLIGQFGCLPLTVLGIGSKRMDTSEEHVIMSQSTTYFSSQDESSRSRSVRRAASLGPGVLFSQPNSDDEELDDDLELHGVPREGGDVDDWVGVSRRGRENMMRSASALPASHDGTAWHRDGFSRRPSFSDELDPLSGDGQAELDNLAVRGRGPSPAYTSTAPVPPAELRRSSLRQSYSPMPSRAPGVSPIASAPSSPRAHDRDDSTETERRLASRRSSLAFRHGLLDEGGDGADLEHRAPTRARDESALDDEEPTPTRPILSTAGHRVGSGEVRFAHTVRNGAGTIEPGESHSETPGAIPRTNRAASVRTMDSSVSDSSSSLTSSSQEPSPGDTHPIGTVVQPISVVSTAVNSPAPSASPSIRTRHSTETVPMTSLSSPPTRRSTLPDSDQSVPSPGSGLSRQSRRLSNNPAVPARSQASSVEPIEDRSEVRQGRVSRTGNASTIVTAPDAEAGPSSRTSMNSTRSQNPSATARSASGASMGSQRSGQLPQSGPRPTGEPSEDGRGRDKSKFSISAALRGLSKGRLSSKSRTREDKSRTPSFNEPRPPMPSVSVGTAQSGSGSAVPQRLVEGERTGRPVRGTSFGQVGDFVPPYGQGGAGDQIRSKGRTASPVGMRDEREESRGRGRNKGMKVLTGALGFGATHEEEDDDVHNWKEFRKGESRKELPRKC